MTSIALRATGDLAAFNEAGILSVADVHVATTIGRLGGEPDERVLLAIAFAVRAVRHGSVCIDLHDVRRAAAADTEEPVDLDALPWPEPADWYAACRVSPIVGDAESANPLRLVDDLLYLDRYWRQEQLVRAELDARAGRIASPVDSERLRSALRRVFPGDAPDYQRLAAAACVTGSLTVLAGGPGTGKTTTIARVLTLLNDVLDRPPRVALAAPTGKAAARLQEAVGSLSASTLHRLLGSRPDSHSRFKHDRHNRLPFDVVVVDETSMVSLTLMSRLLEAVRPDARLVLVGDPDQLSSVEAGAVLGDLVHRPPLPGRNERAAALASLVPDDVQPADDIELRNDVVRLRHTHRYGGSISDLAVAIRSGDPDGVLAVLRSRAEDVEFVDASDGLRVDVVRTGVAISEAARAGDVPAALAALEQHRMLCAHRRGPYGVARWSAEIEQWLAGTGHGAEGEWYPGRPLLVTANDYELRLYNGDTGVVVDGGERGPVAAFVRGSETITIAPSRLAAVQTVHAMTIHRSQGSQFERVSVLLPPADSPLLTRELLYTAVTRAKTFVRVIGSEEAVRLAVTRPVVRASGLRRGR